jgi:hypothetical protein
MGCEGYKYEFHIITAPSVDPVEMSCLSSAVHETLEIGPEWPTHLEGRVEGMRGGGGGVSKLWNGSDRER